MDRIEVKTAENQLRQEFIQGYGYPPRIAEALVNTVTDHDRSIYSHLFYYLPPLFFFVWFPPIDTHFLIPVN
ncbi:MAG: hypothetical protein HXS48_00380 [Theionarchaea archaeon]|nr:hypothetical protein [Theionarchaea archaeon]